MNRLRVAVFGPDGPGSLAREITDELNWLGHDASLVENQLLSPTRASRTIQNAVKLAQQGARKRSPRAALSMSRWALNRIEEHNPDIIITPDAHIPRTLVEAMRNAAGGAPVVLWYPDAFSNFKDQNLFLAGFDLVLLKDRYAVELFRDRYGMNEVHLLPEGSSSLIPEGIDSELTQAESEEFGDKVVVVGNLYPSRLRLLDNIAEQIPLALYGTEQRTGHFPRVDKLYTGKYVTGLEKFRVFRHSLAVLNNLHYSEVGGVNHRIFDATSAGACVLVDDVPQIREYFKPGQEVITYTSVDDLVNIVSDLTDEESRRIGDAARERTHNEHRLEHRLETLFKLAGFG